MSKRACLHTRVYVWVQGNCWIGMHARTGTPSSLYVQSHARVGNCRKAHAVHHSTSS